MKLGLRLRHLAFLSPTRPSASIEFGAKLNVVYGASNTGKSFIADAIDFMLGGQGPLRDIPERIGYDQVLLAVETLDGQGFTLVRSPAGGAFKVYQGVHREIPSNIESKDLADHHSDRTEDNLSAYLLARIDLAKKRVRRNKRGDTQSLSFRNLARLVLINEEEIIQRRSPLSDGNYVADTTNASVFKLLLTGVDDSAYAASKTDTIEQATRQGQIDLLASLIADYRKQIREMAAPPAELEDQLVRLDETIAAQSKQLASSEAEYRALATQRREALKRFDEGTTRAADVANLLERFRLLAAHYASDVARLEGIREAGSLFVALAEGPCPLCGAMPEYHRLDDECDGNVTATTIAAEAEIAKIKSKQHELSATVEALSKEQTSFQRRLPRVENDLKALSGELENYVGPRYRQTRVTFTEVTEKRSEVKEALTLYQSLKDLEERKLKLEGDDSLGGTSPNLPDIDLSSSTTDKFATLVLSILKAWHFPNIERVHFDMKTRDLVINGKNRTSYGKGLRAITHSAFTVGMLEYCRQNDTPHPGFVILDSPLLSYREPDSEDDDLRSSDLMAHFYSYLGAVPNDRQVIIIENTDPPDEVGASPQAHAFSGNASLGRFGFFPGNPDITGLTQLDSQSEQ